MCFVFISEQTATCATYNINWLVFITKMKKQCGPDWVFKQISLRFICKVLLISSDCYFSNYISSVTHLFRCTDLFNQRVYVMIHHVGSQSDLNCRLTESFCHWKLFLLP